jgi:hypothetical protein
VAPPAVRKLAPLPDLDLLSSGAFSGAVSVASLSEDD